ncbi:MAG: L,D-transpeptidase [Actinomycetota bacterium]
MTTTTVEPFRPIDHRPYRVRMLALLVLAAIVMLLTTSCTLPGASGDSLDSGVVVTPDPSTSTTPDPSDQATMADVSDPAFVDASTRAIVTGGPIDVFDAPGGVGVLTLQPATTFGTPRVLLVEEERDGWLKVRLPVRPNHRSGWIPAGLAQVEELDLRVHIDLEARALSVRQGDQTLLSTPVAIGTADNPTPVGTFYVTDKLETPDPLGAYGPFAIGLSGYSETLTEFAGGDGQIGIHGTNDPNSIGRDASHGCIRVPNDIVEQLAALLPLGTPIHIR